MTLQYKFSCDGTWGPEKMPCRAALPTRTIYESTAVGEALRAGWKISPEGDLCPAHARAQEAS